MKAAVSPPAPSDRRPLSAQQAGRLRQLLRANDAAHRQQGQEILVTLAPEGSLRGVDLRGVRLERVHLVGADLRSVNLRDARLAWCDLSGADLSGADLRAADLSYSSLVRANLRDAQTEGMITRHARMTGVQWAGQHPLLGRQLPLLGDWMPDAPEWFRMVPSMARWKIRNVFDGRHPLGVPLARSGENGAGQTCGSCVHRKRGPWGKWRCQRMTDLGARGSVPRETVFRLRLYWKACIYWSDQPYA